MKWGYRFSHYGNTNAGNTHTYKLGFQYAPTDDIRFRASFQRAVRAPNLTELFVPLYVDELGDSRRRSVRPPTQTPGKPKKAATATLAQVHADRRNAGRIR